MASSSVIHSEPTSSSRSCKHDVFLSFRGEDTRKTFVDHLYSALKLRLISVYKDDEALPRGEFIRPSLFTAIEESRIAIIIFSKHYANSSWCLDELAHIMKYEKERALVVMPIFYDVDPSDVRKQKGDFGIAFTQLVAQNSNQAQLWRNALVDASNLAGWEPKHIANGHESKVITEIVESVCDRLFPLNTDVDEGLVGMTTRLNNLKSQLDIESGGVRMVGIWGVGGGGKTTLATSVYMEICSKFQGYCIVENIREESSKIGFKKLQETMLSAVFKGEVTVPSVEEGKRKIKSMLCNRQVLIVLDDVNHLDQLDVLAGSHSWFGNGSRIIITTRDEHLLRTHRVDEVCCVKLLSDDEAIRLFKRHAYNKEDPIEDYESLALRVVSYCAGLPLTLKVLGCFLYDKDSKGWKSTLDRLKSIPEIETVKKLKISYDGLETLEKELFLDIACFWRRKMKTLAMRMLEACDFHPEIGVEVLRQKSLIFFDMSGRFEMHDLVQEMGHYIVREEHPNNPEKHSRLWKTEDINNMCLTMENDKIEAIYCHDFMHGCYTSQFLKNVSNMKKLRYLDVGITAEHDEDLNFLSTELRYIDLSGFRVRNPFAESFKPMKLVVLRLADSMQKVLWKGYKYLPHLKTLRLYNMKELLSTPNFDGLPCLQWLELYECGELENIHTSLGNHTSLQDVRVIFCDKLKMFPTIVHMENLNTLEIIFCTKILEFPEIKANMESLLNLTLISIGIEVLPSSIGERCTNLISLNLCYLNNLKSIEFNFDAFKHLKKLKLFPQFPHVSRKLDLGACRFKDVEIPNGVVELSNLQELGLCGNDFSRIEFSLVQFTRLKVLDLSCCPKLLELPELPSSLTILNAMYCKSLTTFGDCYKNCTGLCQVLVVGTSIINDNGKLLEYMLEVCTAIENRPMFLQLEGAEVAKGVMPCLYGGSRCRLQLPENWCKDFAGFLMCVVFTKATGNCLYNFVDISMKQVMSDMDSKDDAVWEKSDSDRMTWVWYVPFNSLTHTTWWDQTYKALEFHIENCYGFEEPCYSGFGVRLVDRKSRSGLKETSTDSSSDYTPQLNFHVDSESDLRMSLRARRFT